MYCWYTCTPISIFLSTLYRQITGTEKTRVAHPALIHDIRVAVHHNRINLLENLRQGHSGVSDKEALKILQASVLEGSKGRRGASDGLLAGPGKAIIVFTLGGFIGAIFVHAVIHAVLKAYYC